jgi:Protein of unknown function (DUF4197)
MITQTFSRNSKFLQHLARTTVILGLILAGNTSIATTQSSNLDAASGVRGALTQGVSAAITKLGVEGGFLNNPAVKIPLPDSLAKAQRVLKMTRMGPQADALVIKMNQAAEAAVPLTQPLLIDAIKNMTLTDAQGILTGGDDSVTQFFKAKTQVALKTQLLPIVKQSTDTVGLAQQYNGLATKLQPFGLIKGDAANIEGYVTGKTLDGLYTIISQEEKSIRANPLKAASSIVQAVFGALIK